MSNLMDLVEEALNNAREDRERTLEAYEGVKDALNTETADDLQKTMLVGEKPVKLLEQLTRSNEQIVRLAQILQRKEEKDGDKKRQPIDLSQFDEVEEEVVEPSAKIRVEDV